MTSACVVTSSAVVRLVRQEQPRVGEQRGGDHHALQHAARQLVRVLPQPPLAVVDADLLAACSTARAWAASAGTRSVRAQRLGHEVTDAADRIDVGARVLEDHRDLGAVRAELGAGQRR